MRAALLIEPERIEIQEIPTPIPRKAEVLIRIWKAGICGSDYSKFKGHFGGPYGIVPGHEAMGEVVDFGPEAKGVNIGQRVAIQPNFPCRACDVCKKGLENICPHKVRLGMDINGVFAEYVCVPYQNVWALPAILPDAEGVLVEPLSVALHGFNKSLAMPKDRVLIYGAGVIGLFFVRLAALSQACVAAVDVAGPRLEIARKLGAHKTYSSVQELEREAEGFAIVYEASGTTEALSHIVKVCAPGGRVVLTGLPKEDYPVYSNLVVRKELSIVGSMIYINEFPAAIDLLAEGLMKPELFLSEDIPLENLSQTIADFRSPCRVKDLICLA